MLDYNLEGLFYYCSWLSSLDWNNVEFYLNVSGVFIRKGNLSIGMCR